MGYFSKFRMRVKFEFQQQNKIVEGNFSEFYLDDSDSKFEGFDPKNVAPL